ncbi:MAG TPA: DUF1849 family protein, partial [Vineibacter sp.]|nr:DUF1849 family protein [Vineibacter sp.]
MLARTRPYIAVAAVWLAAVAAAVPAQAQELTPHLAVYEVVTGRAPAGASPPEVRGTYAFRLQGECDGGLRFEQRLRFEARTPAGTTEVDQTSIGWEST